MNLSLIDSEMCKLDPNPGMSRATIYNARACAVSVIKWCSFSCISSLDALCWCHSMCHSFQYELGRLRRILHHSESVIKRSLWELREGSSEISAHVQAI